MAEKNRRHRKGRRRGKQASIRRPARREPADGAAASRPRRRRHCVPTVSFMSSMRQFAVPALGEPVPL